MTLASVGMSKWHCGRFSSLKLHTKNKPISLNWNLLLRLIGMYLQLLNNWHFDQAYGDTNDYQAILAYFTINDHYPPVFTARITSISEIPMTYLKWTTTSNSPTHADT